MYLYVFRFFALPHLHLAHLKYHPLLRRPVGRLHEACRAHGIFRHHLCDGLLNLKAIPACKMRTSWKRLDRRNGRTIG